MRGRWVLLAALSVCWQLQWSSAAERGLPRRPRPLFLPLSTPRPPPPTPSTPSPGEPPHPLVPIQQEARLPPIFQRPRTFLPPPLTPSTPPPPPQRGVGTAGEGEICGGKGGRCVTSRKVVETYGGLFYTPRQIRLLQGEMRRQQQEFRPAEAAPRNDDYDQCCPTVRYFDKKDTMVNTRGQSRTIIHLTLLEPPMFQWYPVGDCANVGETHCTGRCVVENSTILLLVLDWSGSWPLAFDSFSVPGYCSCKGI